MRKFHNFPRTYNDYALHALVLVVVITGVLESCCEVCKACVSYAQMVDNINKSRRNEIKMVRCGLEDLLF